MTAITVSNIVLRDVEPPIIKAAQVPEGEYLIDTRPGRRDGTRPAEVVPGPVEPGPLPEGILFEDNFDDQPDWTPAMHHEEKKGTQRVSEGDIIPDGWSSIRHDPTWAPSTGHPDRHESIEILASNADKSRSGTGKSAVMWRDCWAPESGFQRWNSESILCKIFPDEYPAIYAEFWIRFGPMWTREHISGQPSTTSKIFRVTSWNRSPSEFTAFGGGNQGPLYLWDYAVNGFGIRNRHSFRGGPHGDNYSIANGVISGLPRSLSGTGDLSMPFNNGEHLGWGKDGADPVIEDRLNGGLIDLSGTSTLHHDQIFGPGDAWTKLGFYVQMNSAPGEPDGIMRQWLNDEQIVNITTIPWIRPSDQNTDVGWNVVMIGGNDFFQNYPNEDRREEWYAIDDVVIRADIPEALR